MARLVATRLMVGPSLILHFDAWSQRLTRQQQRWSVLESWLMHSACQTHCSLYMLCVPGHLMPVAAVLSTTCMQAGSRGAARAAHGLWSGQRCCPCWHLALTLRAIIFPDLPMHCSRFRAQKVQCCAGHTIAFTTDPATKLYDCNHFACRPSSLSLGLSIASMPHWQCFD